MVSIDVEGPEVDDHGRAWGMERRFMDLVVKSTRRDRP